MNHIGRTIVINVTPGLIARLRLTALIVILIASGSFALNYKAFVNPPTNLCEAPVNLSFNKPVDKDYDHTKKTAANISTRFGVDKTFVEEVILISKGYAYKDFPTITDILSIIGIESSFKPKNEYQGAYGLMQIEFSSHSSEVTQAKDLFDVTTNIALGVKTLRQYYEMLQDKEAAVAAYNVGIGTYLSGKTNPIYVSKYQQERQFYGK